MSVALADREEAQRARAHRDHRHPRSDEQLVTTTLVPKGRGAPRRGDRDATGATAPTAATRPPGERRGPPPRAASAAARGPDGDRRPSPSAEGRPSLASAVSAGPARPAPEAASPSRSGSGRGVHRNAVARGAAARAAPIAEQVLRGGIPAVRRRSTSRTSGRAERGEPAIKARRLVAIAEQLLPRLRTAEWRDRAEAALADVDEVDLRDLRSVVVAADDAARDDETRDAGRRSSATALARRVEQEHAAWLAEIDEAPGRRSRRAGAAPQLPPAEGRRAAADPTLADALAEAASAALTAEAAPDRWAVRARRPGLLAGAPHRRAAWRCPEPERGADGRRAQAGRAACPRSPRAFGIEPTAPRREGRAARRSLKVPKPPAAAEADRGGPA